MDGEVSFISYLFKRIKDEEEEEYDLLLELKICNSYIPVSRTEYSNGEVSILGFRTESLALKNVARSERINKRLTKIKSYRDRFYKHVEMLPGHLTKVLMKYIVFSTCDDEEVLNKACIKLLRSLESERERIHKENVEKNFKSYMSSSALLREERESKKVSERSWLDEKTI